MTTSRVVPEESTTVDFAAARLSGKAFDRGDIDGVLAMYRPDAVLDMSPVGMGVFEGREAIRGVYEDWRASYEDFEQVFEEERELGNGVSFTVVAAYGRLRGSASKLELPYAAVGIWANGLVERHTNYTDIDQARAIAGRLAEERRQAVSPKNLEIVREMYGAFNRGDAETGLRLLHPEPELHQDPEVVDAETYIGLAAFVRGMTLFTDDWDDPRLEPQDVDAIGDVVFMRVRVSGVGKTTRLEMTTQFFHAWTFRDGKPWRCTVRSTREEALKAVGLAA